MNPNDKHRVSLPGLNCGSCGFRTCSELQEQLEAHPEFWKRCIHVSGMSLLGDEGVSTNSLDESETAVGPKKQPAKKILLNIAKETKPFVDSLGRPFDFYLEHFPEDPGPREIIVPRNSLLTRELEIVPGDYLIGRPLGVSCGCPITHCGIVLGVEPRTGVITWCITGPLQQRERGGKDLGYYSAEAYEGIVRESNVEIRIGERYFFQPRRCMLQWRHSGLVNYLNRRSEGAQIRVEGLWIG